MTPWLAVQWFSTSFAQDTEFRSETVAQIRHDLFGEPIVPVYQFLHATHTGPVSVDGYLGFDAITGRSASLSVYALNASGALQDIRWRLGTQQGETVLRPQTFDGLWLETPLGRATEWVTWGGLARHHDLDDLLDGRAMARTELRHHGARMGMRLGAQAEVPGADSGWVGRQDGSLWLGDAIGKASVLAAIAESERGVGVEWARGEIEQKVASGWTGATWVERRATEAETLLADDILPIFAPDGVDEAGLRMRRVGPRMASASASYALGRYTAVAEPSITHRVDVGWTAGSNRRVWPVCAWRWRSGPGGAYHALSAVEMLPFGDRTSLRTQAALVPYRKSSDAWRLAAATGATLSQTLGRIATAQVGADLSSDAVWALDVRAHAALTVESR